MTTADYMQPFDAEQLWAYCGERAAVRKTIKDEKRHAVTATSRLSGALDAECGDRMVIQVGFWDDTATDNCSRCMAALAALAEPERLAAMKEPDVAGRGPRRGTNTLSIFAAA